ncbi:MAG: metallophosphoesterase [Atopobiaceae bacterium]|jgi:Icc-related predicted phosphoesterase|nr:metallophosphoesterase [Atopobiaceae bacterium]MCH4180576.1 metallophosphoesterase [Atopobiaceae bacterium]MCH4214301.1 metallophosphoesterase [Atopobiaceae bacterium]MCH4276126.1 metallophosphoesterase [Atopobiaceae bacterium]MCI1227310.1 metallophosphoesterase [Atopobiaceae bacterium]
MRMLAVSDKESAYLWDYYQPGVLDGIDLIVSCGDLSAEYLSFLATMGNVPVLYVPGNHDGSYLRKPPEGCECVDDRLVTVGGVRILGLGGSASYNGGPYQYDESQMRRRIRRQELHIRRAHGVDVILTHASPRGIGDADDVAHRGFEAFLPLLERTKPRYLIHGHVHLNYGQQIQRTQRDGPTTIVNAFERYVVEL